MLKNITKVDYVFYGLSITLILVFALVFQVPFLVFLVSATGITAGVLNMKGNKYCNIFYSIQIALYAYISFRNKFFGEAILAGLYLFPVYIFSTYKWVIKKGKEEVIARVYKINLKQVLALSIIGIVGTLAYGYFLNFIGSSLPYLNALGTFATIGAGYLYALRIKEQWYLWSSYTIILAIIWISTLQVDKSQITMIVQNIPFLIINIVGLVKWQKLYKEQDQDIQVA